MKTATRKKTFDIAAVLGMFFLEDCLTTSIHNTSLGVTLYNLAGKLVVKLFPQRGFLFAGNPLKAMITHKELIEVFDYCSETGMIRRKMKNGKTKLVGTSCNTGYLQIPYNYKKYQAHRIAWVLHCGSWPEFEIDHINGIKIDNRISNLRVVTHDENMRNQRRYKSSTSGVAGVSWRKCIGKWRSSIHNKGQHYHLGYFTDKQDAIAARKSAEAEYGFHKNHGSTNFA
jgi:hypothetical protein